MSVTFTVFLSDASIPSMGDWQAAVRAAGFDLRLHETIDPRRHTGYLPARLGAAETGFEYCAGPIEADCLPSSLRGRLEGCDRSVRFDTHGDEQELLASLIAAGCLAGLTNGLLFDESSEALSDGASALTQARALQADLKREAAKKAAEKKTPAAFRKRFEACLRDLDPRYSRNTPLQSLSWRVTPSRAFEYTRQDETGLIVSQSIGHRGGEYFLSFALLFSRRLGRLYSPLVNGTRLGEGTCRDSFDKELVPSAASAPDGPAPHAWYGFRRNTFDLVRRDVAINEEHLLPFYRDRIRGAAAAYKELFEQARWLIETLQLSTDLASLEPEPGPGLDAFHAHLGDQGDLDPEDRIRVAALNRIAAHGIDPQEVLALKLQTLTGADSLRAFESSELRLVALYIIDELVGLSDDLDDMLRIVGGL